MMYLAAPYTHHQAWVREARARITAQVAGELARAFIHDWVFAPTVQGHAVAPHLPGYVAREHGFWMRQCEQALAEAERMILLPLPGWRESLGVQRELVFCWTHNIRVTWLDCRSWAARELRLSRGALVPDYGSANGLLWILALSSPTPVEQMEECGQVVRDWQVVELGKLGGLGRNGTDRKEKEVDNG